MVDINKAKIVFALAGWILLMGFLGFLKNGAIIPIIFNGAVALRTTILGWFTYRGSKLGYYITVIWLSLTFISYSYMALFNNVVYENSSHLINITFASMGIFCLVTVIFLLKSKKPALQKL